MWAFLDEFNIFFPDSSKTILLELKSKGRLASVQFSSVVESCPTLCEPMDCST